MSIAYVDGNADAVGTLGDTYNITSSNNQLSISIDGGSAQVFALTLGGTRSATQIVSDLSALTGAVASVVTINGMNLVRIRTNSSNKLSSTIQFNSVANSAHTTLGFLATTYTGGSNVNTTFVTSSKQNFIDGLETALNSAGWLTISGHGTTNLLMQSSMTPSPQNLRMRLRVKDNGNNCAVISIENAFGSVAGNNSTVSGAQMLPGTSKTWRVIANKYQAFVIVPASTTAREFAAWGVPYLPTPLQGVIYECIWMNSNAVADTDTQTRGSLRTILGGKDSNNFTGNSQHITNGNFWELSNVSQNTLGVMTLVGMGGCTNKNFTNTHYRWHDGASYLTEPIISYGLTSANDEGLGRGQLWDAFISMEAYAIDSTLIALNSHDWFCITANCTGVANSYERGSLFVATS